MKRKLIGLMLAMMVSETGLTAIAAQGGTTAVVQEWVKNPITIMTNHS